MIQHSEQAKHVVDGISVTAVAGALVGLLPALAAGFTVVWTGIRIYETKTVQRWLRKRRAGHRAK